MPAMEHILPKETGQSRLQVPICETLAVLLVALLIGWLIDPADPFFLQYRFPWLVLACLLPSLRYGFAFGLGSAVLLIGLLALAAHWQLLGVVRFPTHLGLGLLVVAMLAGEFADTWTKRLSRQRIINTYQRMRLEEFTLSYNLLKVSHDRMEHQLAAGSVSLRGALMEFRRFLLQRDIDLLLTPEPAQQILRLFGDYVAIRVAGIYAFDKAGALVPRPLATQGQLRISPAHEMVQLAVANKVVMSARDLLEHPGKDGAIPLAAVPVVDVNDCVHAVLVVEDMPFVALQEENLKLLAVLGGHIGDLLSLARERRGEDVVQIRFENELKRAIIDCRRYALPSMLVTIHLPQNELTADIESLLSRQVRGLDRLLIQEFSSGRLLRLLMPLTGPLELNGWQQRIDRILQENLGARSEELGLGISSRELRSRDRVSELLGEIRGIEG